MANQQFSDVTIELTKMKPKLRIKKNKNISKEEQDELKKTEQEKHSIETKMFKKAKQKNGEFITPNLIIEKFFQKIKSYADLNNIQIQTILEPACGTCAIVDYCDKHFAHAVSIDAIEIQDKFYNKNKKMTFKNTINMVHADFIAYKTVKTYDLTLSNPPYFVCEKGYKIPSEYAEYIIGRPNIFGLFILKQLSMTRVGGLAGFIIPKSFMNSFYYGKIRDYVKATCTIVSLEDYSLDNKFIDTQQATFGLILHKVNEIGEEDVIHDCPYSVKIGEHYVFTPDALALKELLKGSTTLAQLGFAVRTGNIVWNQCKAGNTDGKPELTADSTQTVLIYDSNITKDHKIKLTMFKNEEKHQYIKREGRTDMVLAVKRGHGNSAYKLDYALIDMKTPYLCENHINEIYPSDSIKKGDVSALFIKIMKSFENPKTQQFIDLFLGNNGLSKTELETLFPIF